MGRAVERLGPEGLRVAPLTPADGEALRELWDRLSEDTIRQRFFRGVALDDDLLAELLTVDGSRRLALVGWIGTHMVSVARLAREVGAEAADFAIVVVDELQQRGLGAAMLDALVSAARDIGVRSLHADVLAANDAMMALLKKRPEPLTMRSYGTTVTVHLDIS